MTRLFMLGCTLLALGCQHGAPRQPDPHDADRAQRLHAEALVFDAHCDTLLHVVDEDLDLGAHNSDSHVDLPRLRAGGVDIQVFAAFVEPRFVPGRAMARAVQLIDALQAQVRRHADQVALARTVAQARQIHAQGKLAALIGLEGGYAIGDDPARLKPLFDRGVRYMTLTWRQNTGWADGSEDTPRHNGLNALGRRVIREMNRLGMVVDLSHVSDKTFWDVLDVSTKPVIASHSNSRALCDHPRNLTDAMLRGLAKNGGVVGINFAAGFLDASFSKKARARLAGLKPRLEQLDERCKEELSPARCRQERRRLYRGLRKGLAPVPLSRVIDHVDHMVKVAGVDHVGLGSDFDGFGTGPQGLEDVSKLPEITRLLLARGYSEADVKKILGGNFLRVFEQVIGR